MAKRWHMRRRRKALESVSDNLKADPDVKRAALFDS